MQDNLRRLRDAVVGRGREVEVSPEGTVRQIRESAQPAGADADTPKSTKLSDRTWGAAVSFHS